jgi:uncharacterized protein YgbK (DUF1537 family)
VVAPAFPEQGRVYVDGSLHGVRVRDVLAETAERCRIEDDLSKVQLQAGMLLVGSGGLARRLAGPARVVLPQVQGSVLVVAGSPARETQRQLECLPAHVEVLRTPPGTQRDSGEAAAALAQQVAARSARPALLLLTGGQTARLTCEALQVHAVHLLGEVQPGMPIGRLRGGKWDQTIVITKAGGFGKPEALLDALRLLSPSSPHTP